ncbi:type II toxin-antitoxin system HicB family antitoxin [Sulfitobacter sp. G21635-S1]|jgi:predicted HicB family RNase H-like nuclease|uniref:type II toxin-antitoxin system HicB family antitoxin n=1 Tax=Sulfitobacter sp. G21635-S1 TaxID=3014043 RepID=UPI0022AE93DE|nr:type II toxin-antitoxin system HicB family antitoxin [Sulfitobacter sp. G21635-S1]MCZ4254745.1 type II toxin-antitoxin system HicB family antitoxin [Sulfitobacter sp. G21635-S1]
MKPYKGYTASIWYESDDLLFHGTVEGIRDTVHFAGASAQELERAFRDSVDDYLNWCAEDGVEPNKPYSGRLAFRTTPEHHRLISEAASAQARSINQWMDEVLEEAARKTLDEGRQKIKFG